MPLQGLQVHVQFFEENCDELRKVTNTGPPFTVPIDNLAVASAQLWSAWRCLHLQASLFI
jgi:hypothetical protein